MLVKLKESPGFRSPDVAQEPGKSTRVAAARLCSPELRLPVSAAIRLGRLSASPYGRRLPFAFSWTCQVSGGLFTELVNVCVCASWAEEHCNSHLFHLLIPRKHTLCKKSGRCLPHHPSHHIWRFFRSLPRC